MKIKSKIHVGYRHNDSFLWREHIIPRFYISPFQKTKTFYVFYLRWLNFYIYKIRTCDRCGKSLESSKGCVTNIYEADRNKIIMTICKECRDNRMYITSDKQILRGYNAWIREVFDKNITSKGEFI